MPQKKGTTPHRSHTPRPKKITKTKYNRSKKDTGTGLRRKVSQLQDPLQMWDPLRLQDPSQCQDPQLVDAKVDPLPQKQKAQSTHEAHLNKMIQVIKQGLLEKKTGMNP